jgi:CxxC motif-containing protein (DUF1111 family)
MSKLRLSRNLVHSTACVLVVLPCAGILSAQTDPGPRGGRAGAGGPFPALDANEKAFLRAALERFKEIDSVSGNISGEAGVGLGPGFNANSCAACHAQPATGGSSPTVNPQVALATLDGAQNSVPSFITMDGPVRETRFIYNDPATPNSGLDGGVHDIYTIAGRSDAPGCDLPQPDYDSQIAANNVIFRIPTPLFGLGLVEMTPDATLEANLNATASQRSAAGIGGEFNHSGNDGTITRFGWKAQNKSLLIFAGEAYNVEQGVSNEAFPNERNTVPGCVFNDSPEDSTDIDVGTGDASDLSSDVVNFAAFARLSAPPAPTTSTASQKNGQTLFVRIGCNLCHSPTLKTGTSAFTGMSDVTYHPYSDIALHHMGSKLADGVNQGNAGPDEFRTTPLWGIGQRLFFLHDGRTSDLLQAILDHQSSGSVCTNQSNPRMSGCGSEANQVIAAFSALSTSQKQDILNFLRSL